MPRYLVWMYKTLKVKLRLEMSLNFDRSASLFPKAVESVIISYHSLVKPDVVKQKLGFISKIMRMQTSLRQNRELFIKLKGIFDIYLSISLTYC